MDDYAHNARLDSGLYGQCWTAEAAFSATKRRFGPPVHPRTWYREFRELVLTTKSTTSNKLLNSDPHAILGFNKAVDSN